MCLKNIRATLITRILVAINILVYIYICWLAYKNYGFINISTMTQVISAKGGLVVDDIINHHQYYRLFTSLFLHFSFWHLATNMLTLYFIGNFVESLIGKIRYFLLYFGAGLGANIVSLYLQENHIVSAGASGAIFGLFSFLVLAKWYYPQNIAMLQVTKVYSIFIIMNVIFSLKDTSINLIAHLAGFLVGIFIVIVYMLINKLKKNKIIN